ncbi:DUF6452 family protein [Aquimarina sp. I32.4]|uniref:DUF6452 family protein n=1 Tax=Aquimarina sp. I32.4 TaxID=2053903 RepID=UPI0011AF70CC|nr:DUF6452 family protein [Aquimarina sp. I32.4]
MRIYKYLLFLVITTFFLYSNTSCERDDICAEGTPTTSFLIIKFIDFESGSDVKVPPGLEVKATDVETPFPIGTVTESISIPLKSNASFTDYELTINSDTTNTDVTPNTDIINIQYTPTEEYVSSACGFKINYQGLTISPVDPGNDGNWIENITIQRENVNDETAAHVFIFH